MKSILVLVWMLAAGVQSAIAQSELPRFRLTARPWHPLGVSRSSYLDVIEGICRFTAKHQDERGAVIDPFLKREHQYSTPYYAYAIGLLVAEDRAKDLLASGVRAMDHATACFAQGRTGIPDQHGEFFIPALTGALRLYTGHVPIEQFERWRQRMRTPLDRVIDLSARLNNWRTNAMKGDWLRAQDGLVTRDAALTGPVALTRYSKLFIRRVKTAAANNPIVSPIK